MLSNQTKPNLCYIELFEIELSLFTFNYVLTNDCINEKLYLCKTELFKIKWKHLTMCKKMSLILF